MLDKLNNMIIEAKLVSSKPKVSDKLLTNEQIEKLIDILVDWANADKHNSYFHSLKITPAQYIKRNFSLYLSILGNNKPLTVYRGLYFDDKQSMLDFLEKVEKKGLVEKVCRSWTTDRKVADEFYNFFGDYAYGVVLKQRIDKNTAIRVPFYNKRMIHDNESEYILPPGKYEVDIIDWTVFVG